jgi:nicotinate phosphoribosyltransferase
MAPKAETQNLSLLCDFYELTMGNGYFKNGFYKKQTYFDVFFRTVPDQGGYAIASGLHDIIAYVQNLHFEDKDIEFLRGKGIFDEGFLKYLRQFKFTGDIYAVPEGTPVFSLRTNPDRAGAGGGSPADGNFPAAGD